MRSRGRQVGRRTGRGLTLALLLLLTGTGCGGGVDAGGSASQQTSIREEHADVNVVPSAPAALECGSPFSPPSGGRLTLTGHFPPVVRATEQAVSGTVKVTSETDDVRGVITTNADAFLVRNGLIATLPLPQDLVGMRLELARGEVEQLPARASLSPCSSGGGDGGGSLRPGTYELYARVLLSHDDGSSLESIGGPWLLEVR
jgi:hypothetical protein